MAIRLLLASHEPILLYGLEALFRQQPDLEVSVVRATPAAAVAALPTPGPDVLLLDLSPGDEEDVAALRDLGCREPCPATVVLVSSIEPDELLETLALGVRGVLVKEMAPRLFIECVRKVARGERWVELRSESLALELVVRRESAMRRLAQELTPRELEIVPLVTAGLGNKEIGARLGISHSTVKVHLKNVFRKLGIDGRMALLRWSEEHGLRNKPSGAPGMRR